MKNPFASLFCSVLQWFRRTRRNPSRACQSDRKGAVSLVEMASPSENPQPLSQEQFRQMLAEALADPETARLVMSRLVGTVLPVQGGTPAENYICKFNAAGNPVDTATPIFEKDGNKIGIGTTTPGEKLDVIGNVRAGFNTPGTHYFLKTFATPNAGGNVPSELRVVMDDGGPAGMIIKDVRDGSYNSQSIEFSTSHGGVSVGTRMAIDKDGNVGIGTASPSQKLQVEEGGILSRVTGDVPNILLNQLSSSHKRTQIAFQHQGAGQFLLGVDPGLSGARSFFLHDTVANLQRLLVDPNGNVGIGTTTPQQKLDVVGIIRANGTGAYVELLDSSAGANLKNRRVGSVGGTLYFQKVDDAGSSTNHMVIDSSGNVGIGTTSPAEKLDVNGNIKSSGTTAFGGTTINNSLATGYVVVKVDSTYQDTQQEVRGMDGFIRSYFSSSVDRDAGTGLGWDRFGVGAGVEILEANKEYILGQQKGVAAELYVDQPTAIDTWQASHVYALQKLVQPTTPNGRYYRVIVAGTSGSGQPTWPTTDGGTVSDGSVTWKETPLVEEMVDFQAYIEVDDKTSVGSWWGLIINGPNIGSAATPGKIRKGYGVYIQDLNEKSVITQANAAAIKIDGLNEYGRILWNNSSIYEVSSGHLEIKSTNLGFYGVTPVAQQAVTGSKGGNAALANLLTALANLGLIVDSTS